MARQRRRISRKRWVTGTLRGMMFAVAVASLLAWPLSNGCTSEVVVRRSAIQPTGVDRLYFRLAVGDGVVGASLTTGRKTGRPGWGEQPGWSWSGRCITPSVGSYEGYAPSATGVTAIRTYGFPRTEYAVAASCWLLALVTGAWPAVGIWAHLRPYFEPDPEQRAARFAARDARRHPPGICRACGYDLRATPDRCPECGVAAAGADGDAEAQRR